MSIYMPGRGAEDVDKDGGMPESSDRGTGGVVSLDSGSFLAFAFRAPRHLRKHCAASTSGRCSTGWIGDRDGTLADMVRVSSLLLLLWEASRLKRLNQVTSIWDRAGKCAGPRAAHAQCEGRRQCLQCVGRDATSATRQDGACLM